jgi:hypothetical protein
MSCFFALFEACEILSCKFFFEITLKCSLEFKENFYFTSIENNCILKCVLKYQKQNATVSFETKFISHADLRVENLS